MCLKCYKECGSTRSTQTIFSEHYTLPLSHPNHQLNVESHMTVFHSLLWRCFYTCLQLHCLCELHKSASCSGEDQRFEKFQRTPEEMKVSRNIEIVTDLMSSQTMCLSIIIRSVHHQVETVPLLLSCWVELRNVVWIVLYRGMWWPPTNPYMSLLEKCLPNYISMNKTRFWSTTKNRKKIMMKWDFVWFIKFNPQLTKTNRPP